MRQESALREHATTAETLNAAFAPATSGHGVQRAGRDAQQQQQRRRVLTRTVELDVIPRLLLRQCTLLPARPGDACGVAAGDVAELVELVLARDEGDAFGFVAKVHRKGASPEAIMLDLLSPAARQLGVLWERDDCDFTTVTIALWRLQVAMTEFRPTFLGHADAGQAAQADAPRILLVPLPGEQHGFGLAMVHDFFCRAGWNAWTGALDSSAELAAMVRHEWTDVVGFALACDEGLDTLRAEIRRVRRASCNPALGVMVGGPVFTANPHLAAVVGADATAMDGRQAVAQARTLLGLGSNRTGPTAR